MQRIWPVVITLCVLVGCSAQSSAIEMPSEAIVLEGENPLRSATPSPSESLKPTSEPTEDVKPMRDPDAEVEIEDQSGDGTRLTIDEVEFSLNHVWLVIHSKSGELYHSELLSYGVKKASIQLMKTLITGEYIVSLHSDNGDKVFDASVDPVIRGEENELAREDFEYRRTK